MSDKEPVEDPSADAPDAPDADGVTVEPAEIDPTGDRSAAEPGDESDGESEGGSGDESDDRTPARARTSWRTGAVIGVLAVALGFGLAVQVRQNSAGENLAGARQEDLVRILEDLDSREQRLRTEVGELQGTKDELTSGGDQAKVAQEEAKKRSSQLAILAGTVAAKGPGITLQITDPQGGVTPEVMLDAIQELRAAGAEAIQVNDVRVGVSTAVTGAAGNITLDGVPLSAPYTILAIGSGDTMSAAMNIPGGVVASVRFVEGEVTITASSEVLISALRDPDEPDYAQPAEPSK